MLMTSFFIDPFGGGSDPFSSTDPFSSVTTPKAGDMVGVVMGVV